MATMTTGTVRVEIYDQEYQMTGELDAEYIRELAKFVDGKMRAIAGRNQVVDSLRVAVLAALNIADDLHQLKGKRDAVASSVTDRVAECNRRLDQILKPAV
jgi:cell division protein ZapA